jgi:hypothetical protein
MEPSDFAEANVHLVKGEGHPEDTGALPVYTDGRVVISRWELTADDRRAIAAGDPIWLCVLTGTTTQPPVALMTLRPAELPETSPPS